MQKELAIIMSRWFLVMIGSIVVPILVTIVFERLLQWRKIRWPLSDTWELFLLPAISITWLEIFRQQSTALRDIYNLSVALVIMPTLICLMLWAAQLTIKKAPDADETPTA